MDSLLGLTAGTEDLAFIEGLLILETFPDEGRGLSCLVGDLLGD